MINPNGAGQLRPLRVVVRRFSPPGLWRQPQQQAERARSARAASRVCFAEHSSHARYAPVRTGTVSSRYAVAQTDRVTPFVLLLLLLLFLLLLQKNDEALEEAQGRSKGRRGSRGAGAKAGAHLLIETFPRACVTCQQCRLSKKKRVKTPQGTSAGGSSVPPAAS
jgi:hypothetical protein